MIHRKLEQVIKNDFNKSKAIVVMGARQVGKTTALKHLVDSKNSLMLNCDDYDDRVGLENRTSTELRNLIGNHKVVIIDEAQRVRNIGLALKMIVDMNLPVQILVSGSSSFSLSDEGLEMLNQASESYLKHRFEKDFKTLIFYKTIS